MFRYPPNHPNVRPPFQPPSHRGPGFSPQSFMPPMANRGMPFPPPVQAPPAAAGGGFLQSLISNVSGGGGIEGAMGNMQNMLKLAESAAPIVKQAQQYGPMLKNLPAMFKMMKAFTDMKGSGDETATEESGNQEPSVSATTAKKTKEPLSNSDNESVSQFSYEEEYSKEVEKPSTPKLYV
ncbi:VrrA/YqfQ family protein [Aureibacillus halotolerans]|uniref:YqfQ-like protein n=1 Tax=Aureibacillus halotolerans TaxID=1508390 RepID=A0A4R6U4C4_9BACI|nr:VrrA/YqfQ family protein [Aureibacillus halotolerans]TDQ40332.1 YqfQ-like protein [Aureibacillus halotolerans]